MTNPLTAALPATATVAPTTDLDLVPAGLTESTRRIYALCWGQWERWCAARGICALPADPLALCAYLTERADAGKATGTLDMVCAVIRHVHRACRTTDPSPKPYARYGADCAAPSSERAARRPQRVSTAATNEDVHRNTRHRLQAMQLRHMHRHAVQRIARDEPADTELEQQD